MAKQFYSMVYFDYKSCNNVSFRDINVCFSYELANIVQLEWCEINFESLIELEFPLWKTVYGASLHLKYYVLIILLQFIAFLFHVRSFRILN